MVMSGSERGMKEEGAGWPPAEPAVAVGAYGAGDSAMDVARCDTGGVPGAVAAAAEAMVQRVVGVSKRDCRSWWAGEAQPGAAGIVAGL